MRILQLLSTSSVTGPAELCLDDARALRAAGHEVLFGCDTRRPGNYVEAIRAAGFELMEELTLCPKPTPAELARDAVRLRARMCGADLVHCRFAHDHTVALLARIGLGRGPALVRTAEIARSLRPGVMRGASLRACQAVVVSCRAYADRAQREHHVPAERVHLLAGRVDAARFSPADGGALRRDLGVAAGETLFGIVSRIKEDRRHDLLVRAFAPVARERADVKLAIVGRGEFEPQVRALIEQLGVSRQVVFAGYRTGGQLVEAYRALDASIWLAEGNDGTCRAVLEALACGKPVLAGPEGAMAEIVREGREGHVVELREAAISAGLARLADRDQRAALAANARARALEFTAERRARELLRVYGLAASVR